MFIRFDRIYERDSHTDGQTDGQTPHDAAKSEITQCCLAFILVSHAMQRFTGERLLL